jgi:hypothetical protein
VTNATSLHRGNADTDSGSEADFQLVNLTVRFAPEAGIRVFLRTLAQEERGGSHGERGQGTATNQG